jgi:SprB repeat/Secretion system C-terminal sorting domain
MKKFILLFISAFLVSPFAFSAQGGPDTYGYTWIDSNEPGGPLYSWIDITGSGTQVSGLTDDNSVAFVPMGMDFHYYWGDYDQIKIGSNGWLSFENTGNIAHCFPAIPTPGGASDTYLAPFMTDLTFDGLGNIGDVYYFHDVPNEQFIISFLNIPWWIAAAPTWAGDNSFQVILDATDSSITFQYQNADVANFNDLTTCATDLVIGIEGPTGSIGLTVYQDVIPPSSYAIKFVYPNPVLISIPDVTPNWTLNVEKGGDFNYNGFNVNIPINIKTVGNVDVTSNIVVDVIIQDQSLTTVGTFTQTLIGGLPMGVDSTIQYTWIPSALGQYSVRTIVSNVDDINATNDTLRTEIQVQDPNPLAASRYTYINSTDVLQGTIAWNSGSDDGVGSRFVPSSYPVIIDSIGAYVNGTGDVRLEMYADDGVNNMPGTLLWSETFISGSVPLDTWVTSVLTIPDTIYSGGFYVTWIQPNLANTSLATILTPPFSRRCVELVSGWAIYRDNETQDFMIDAWGTNVCADLTSSGVITATSCIGVADGSIDLTAVGGNPSVSGYTYSWTNGAGTVEDPTNLVGGSYIVTVTDSVGCEHISTYIVTEPVLINATDVTTDEIAGNDGSIDITVSGGVPPYTYSWSGGAGTSEDPSGLAGGTYTVTITDSDGCMNTYDVTVNSQLGLIEDGLSISWNVFPNPSNGEINVFIDNSLSGDAIIEIRDLLGRLIYSDIAKSSQQIQLDQNGVYLIVLSTSNGKSVKRIIVQ